jgi:hypothetical protein
MYGCLAGSILYVREVKVEDPYRAERFQVPDTGPHIFRLCFVPIFEGKCN